MISIPSGVYTKYREAADLMITEFGQTCTLEYSTITTTTSSPDIKKRKVMNLKQSSAPSSFGRGEESYKNVVTTEDITMRVYWSKKDWVKVGDFEHPDNSIQTIGYLTDLKSVKRSNKMKIDNGEVFEFQLIGEPVPHGLLQDRYILCFWKRV